MQILIIISLCTALYFVWGKLPKPIQSIGNKAVDISKDVFSDDSKPPQEISTFVDSALKKIDVNFKE